MTVQDVDVAPCPLLADMRSWAPQSSHPFDRAASDLLSEQTRSVVLQENVEFLEHDSITRQFNVAHFRGCATLFN